MASHSNMGGANKRESHFRFLDLPAEMRNRVYEELLVHDRAQGRLATSQLLRVCRQINDEAKGLLYTSTSLTVDVKFFISEDVFNGEREHAGWKLTSNDQEWRKWYEKSDIEKAELEAEGYSAPPSPHRNSTVIVGEPYYYKPCLTTGDIRRCAEPLTLRQANELWPSKLCDIPTLNLNISLDLDPVFATDETLDNTDFSALNFFFYSLFSHLSISTKKQKIILTLTDHAGCTDQEIAFYCYPFLKIPANIEIEINHDDLSGAERIELLQNGGHTPAIKNNILANGVDTLERLEKLLSGNYFNSFECPAEVVREARNAWNFLKRVLETDDWGWIGVEDDLYCSKVVALASEVLREVPGSKKEREAWLARLRALVVNLETVVEDYWWTWGDRVM